MRTTTFSFIDHVPAPVRDFPKRRAAEIAGFGALAGVACLCLALLTWSVSDPSLNHATNARVHNLLGAPGAVAADLVMQFIGLASAALLTPPAFWGWRLLTKRRLERPRLKIGLYLCGVIAAAGIGVAPSDARKPGRCRPVSAALSATRSFRSRVAPFSLGLGHDRAGRRPRRPLHPRTRRRVKPRGPPRAPSDGAVRIRPEGPAPRRLPVSTTRRTRMRRASASCRSAPSFMPCSPPRGRCAESRVAARGRRASPRPSSAPGLRPPQPARRGQDLGDVDDALTGPAAYAPRPQGSSPAPTAGAPPVVLPPAALRSVSRPAVEARFAAFPRGEWIMPSMAVLTLSPRN